MSPEMDFITRFPDAAMITVRRNGSPHAARVELGVVHGRIQTIGAPGLVRTRNLRRNPYCTLFVFGPTPFWLGADVVAHILDGADAAERCIELLHSRHAPPDTSRRGVMAHDDHLETDRYYELDEYRAHAAAQGLFVFDFDITRTYGNYDPSHL